MSRSASSGAARGPAPAEDGPALPAPRPRRRAARSSRRRSTARRRPDRRASTTDAGADVRIDATRLRGAARASSTATRTCRSPAGARRSTSRRSPACPTRRSRARGGGIASSARARSPQAPTRRCSAQARALAAEMLAARHDDLRGQDAATGSRSTARRAPCAWARELGRRPRHRAVRPRRPAGLRRRRWMDERRRAGRVVRRRRARHLRRVGRLRQRAPRAPGRDRRARGRAAARPRRAVQRQPLGAGRAGRGRALGRPPRVPAPRRRRAARRAPSAPRCCCPAPSSSAPSASRRRARSPTPARSACSATDCNPGTSPVVVAAGVIGLAVRRYGWSVREALLACTLNAAWVLGLSGELGSLEVGKRADLVLLDAPVAHLPYRFGRNPVCLVVRAGEVGLRAPRRRVAGRVVIAAADLGAAPGRPRAHRPRRARHHAAGLDARGRGRRRVVRRAGRRRSACASSSTRPATAGRVPDAPGPWWGVGSHLDSVRAGGRYDGALGVCAALRRRPSTRRWRSSPSPTRRARASTRRPSAAGRWPASSTPAVLERRDDDGVRLADAMARRRRRSGRRRAARRRGSGACAASSSCTSTRPPTSSASPSVRAPGGADARAGRPARPRRPRRAPRAATSAPTRCCAPRSSSSPPTSAPTDDMVVTASRMLVEPNALTTIAAHVRLWLDARSENPVGAHRAGSRTCPSGARADASPRARTASSSTPRCAPRSATRTGVMCFAGHDAGILAAKIPAAMVLVRNPSGISHSPEEAADLDDAAAAATRASWRSCDEGGAPIAGHAQRALARVPARPARARASATPTTSGPGARR